MNICEHCGECCEKVFLTVNGESICADCLEENNYVECLECGQWVEASSDNAYSDSHICNCCLDRYYFLCDACGEITHGDDGNWVNNDEDRVCDSCHSDYIRCSHCGDYFSEGNIWHSDENSTICNLCSDDYFMCDDCSYIYHVDDMHSTSQGRYCRDCSYEHDDCSSLNNYSYKPDPIFLGNDESNFYMGVELEVDNGNDINDCASNISNTTDDIYLKSDGSLDCGIEIVSHPATYEHHCSALDWNQIMQICRQHGFKSHDTNTCGLHVHVNRDYFGDFEEKQDLHIAKLIILINRFWDSFIVPFSRRDISGLERWANKNELDSEPNDSEIEIINKLKQNAHKGRYQAINLTNYSTIEFRFFRGTLKYSTFIASLQLVKLLCEYAVSTTLRDIHTAQWNEIILNSNFKELKDYCEKKTKTFEKEVEVLCA